MLKHLLGILTIAGLFIGLLSGCGGGGSEPTTAPLTKAEFLKQGNATCKKGFTRVAKAMAAATAEGAKLSKAQQQHRLTKAVLGAYSEMVADLRKLGVPAGEKEAVDRILSAYEKEIASLEGNPHQAFSGKLLFVRANRQAGSYGLGSCRI